MGVGNNCLARLFGKLCSVKVFVFLCFVFLRCFDLVGAEHLTAVGLSVIGVNSGMKVYHTLTDRLNRKRGEAEECEAGG